MTYGYRKLDSFGETFFRILERATASDAWAVVRGTFDYSREEDAIRKVDELNRGSSAPPTTPIP